MKAVQIRIKVKEEYYEHLYRFATKSREQQRNLHTFVRTFVNLTKKL